MCHYKNLSRTGKHCMPTTTHMRGNVESSTKNHKIRIAFHNKIAQCLIKLKAAKKNFQQRFFQIFSLL